LLTRRVSPDKIYREIDWPLLVMFVGLFVVVAGFEKVAIAPNLHLLLGHLHLDNIGWLGLVTAVLSNIVSNVPAVLVLKPFVAELHDPQRAWLVVAMTSTLAGNFTLLGSVANLIVAQRAQARGVTLDFWSYFLIGAPLTVITIGAGLWWMM
ncbi:MAG TPA: SLC13 family permease, partial [Pseudolabrys sp.]|nr:SLC13 family permease [Pseudolabrys sp.]